MARQAEWNVTKLLLTLYRDLGPGSTAAAIALYVLTRVSKDELVAPFYARFALLASMCDGRYPDVCGLHWERPWKPGGGSTEEGFIRACRGGNARCVPVVWVSVNLSLVQQTVFAGTEPVAAGDFTGSRRR
ncbi:predicted protein [Coccidioides posadasii str. Silveira]|uniref:Predicted protein n=2 Tax=Coccidioides posadasii TaxID=199306 RepID=E9D5B8_COCPS|nr:predicted protein [Coccidioides posadasii str. Silveira]KMM66496.1 hypothetical protein CPAG_02835 [Coccidioides posadasii RMSCC 3488]